MRSIHYIFLRSQTYFFVSVQGGFILHRLLLLLFSLLASFPLAAQERPRAALAPVGSLDVPTAQQVILFNRFQDRLSTRYDLVSQSDFASAQDEVFTSLTAEECTEENCIGLIQELLQVEDYFHLQLVRSGQDTQLTLTAVDLDKRQMRSEYCESCDQRELNHRLDTLITSLLPQVETDLQAEMEQDLERQAVESCQQQEEKALQILRELAQLLQRSAAQAGAAINRYQVDDSTNRFISFFEKQDPNSDNVYLEDRKLVIQAKYETTAGAPSGVIATLARLKTDTSDYRQAVGSEPCEFYEVRAKIPCIRGVWPAIWMLGKDGVWPD